MTTLNPNSGFITVIIPVFNGSIFLKETVRSVLSQDYRHFELLIINDGSTDGSGQIMNELAQIDDRIRVIHQKNLGVAAARNRGIRASRGEYCAFLDADDRWETETLGLWHQALHRLPKTVGVVYGWSLDVDEHNQLTGGFHGARVMGGVLPTLLAHNFLGNASATMVRRSLAVLVGGYDASLRDRAAQGCEDWDFYLKLAEICEFAVVPRFLVRYCKPMVSMSSDYDQMARSHQLVLDALHQRVPSLPRWLYRLSKSSLYVHFAHLSAQSGKNAIARQWCQRAWDCDRFTPLLRPGWYRMRFGRRAARSDSAILGRIPSNRSLAMPSGTRIAFKMAITGLLHRSLRWMA